MYPQLPTTFDGMSAKDLRVFAAEIRSARKAAAVANPRMSAEDHDEWTQWGVILSRVVSLAQDADAAELDDAVATAAAAALAEATVEETETEEADEAVEEAPTATSTLTVVEQTLTLPAERTLITAGATRWQSTGVSGPVKDTPFSSTREMAVAMQDVMARVAAGDNEKRTIATMRADFKPHELLTGPDLFMDLAALMSRSDEEIEAAFCTPLTPLYDLACANVTRRPVFNGLPRFGVPANRGGFRVPESPSFYDISGGFGQWTSADDANAQATKEACATIECVNWNDFEWYGTYRCLTVKNLMSMTFPELVDAYLNRLQAAWARYAEILLLEQMGNASTTITAPRQAFGANVSLQRILLTYLGLYAEQERWDAPMVDAWMPRWLQWALRMDIASRRKDGSGRVPSEAEVNSTFTEVGVAPHWYMDRPSWATPVGPKAVNGSLNFFPSQVEILVHRPGKFAVMDRGELNVGLGGNPIRIEDDLRRNQATFFFESFEGLIDTDSCPADLLVVPGLCYNGTQIADRQIECEGYDMIGVGSA